MNETIKGIMNRYKSNTTNAVALRALCEGGMWLSSAPASVPADLVYVVITPVAGPIEHTMGRTSISPQDIQFMVASIKQPPATVVETCTALRKLYDFCTLTMSEDFRSLMCMPTDQRGPLRDDVTGGHMMYVTYRFLIGG
jgi:hypothetical protein